MGSVSPSLTVDSLPPRGSLPPMCRDFFFFFIVSLRPLERGLGLKRPPSESVGLMLPDAA